MIQTSVLFVIFSSKARSICIPFNLCKFTSNVTNNQLNCKIHKFTYCTSQEQIHQAIWGGGRVEFGGGYENLV